MNIVHFYLLVSNCHDTHTHTHTHTKDLYAGSVATVFYSRGTRRSVRFLAVSLHRFLKPYKPAAPCLLDDDYDDGNDEVAAVLLFVAKTQNMTAAQNIATIKKQSSGANPNPPRLLSRGHQALLPEQAFELQCACPPPTSRKLRAQSRLAPYFA